MLQEICFKSAHVHSKLTTLIRINIHKMSYSIRFKAGGGKNSGSREKGT